MNAVADSPPRAAFIADALRATHQLLEHHGVWHCVTYGTLLGALRDGAVIAWDHDFDLFIRPVDVPAIIALSERAGAEVTFARKTKSSAELAIGASRVAMFDPAALAVFAGGEKIGDLYAPSLFCDGVMRTYDFATEVIWTPHASFPHYFLEGLSTVSIDGTTYPGVGHPEQFLAGAYGEDWRVPYRCVNAGGENREGFTAFGDRYEPRLGAQVDWALQQGWDRSRYSGQPVWPRRVRGAGPVGPTARTASTSRGLWWRDLAEIAEYF